MIEKTDAAMTAMARAAGYINLSIEDAVGGRVDWHRNLQAAHAVITDLLDGVGDGCFQRVAHGGEEEE